MPSLTRAEARALGRRRRQPVKARGEILAVFVGGKLTNPLNASAWGWQKRSRLAKQWKARTAEALMEAGWRQVPVGGAFYGIDAGPKAQSTYYVSRFRRKLVTFVATTWNPMDDDGLAAAIKPIRDALVECGVISGDAPKDGHVFVYSQQIDRANRGVTIRVRLGPQSHVTNSV